MKRISSAKPWHKWIVIIAVLALMMLTACSSPETGAEAAEPAAPETESTEESESTEGSEEETMKMTIGQEEVRVRWEDNEAVAALQELAAEGPVTIEMSMYGGFEQVGPIGTDLPADDAQTTTKAGDIVLYSGDQIVVFYGSNSWSYTMLGHIEDKTDDELKQMLSEGNVTLTISME